MKQELRQENQERRNAVRRKKTDYRMGLTEKEVQERKAKGWVNREVAADVLTNEEIIKSNVFTYFNLIFLVLAILLCIVGSFRNLTFLPVVIGNTCIGIFQEMRAKRVLEKLNILHSPKSKVVRGGVEMMIDSQTLVIDDIVVFSAGNQICADAEVVSGEVQVNESLLTGESDEIVKKRGSSLLSGSFVVSGKCYARLVKVGEDSYISKLTLEAKAMQREENSEMIKSLDKLVKFIGIALIPIGIILFVQSFWFNGIGFKESVEAMVAAIIGMIPEGLYLLASVALAVSTMRLANNQVLLHDMKSIETLARVDVLCVDKTGTITEDAMVVNSVIRSSEYDEEEMPELNRMIGDLVMGMDADNGTMVAMKDYFKKGTGDEVERVIPFKSSTKFSAVVMEENSYVLGAPEFVLRDKYDDYKEEIEKYSLKGFRALVFGEYEGDIENDKLEKEVLPLGYILLLNKVREQAKETFAYFEEQNVAIKVISGDNPLTVSETAKIAGIKDADRFVDARTLTSREDIEEAVRDFTVFGRVVPEQKRLIVQALQGQGHTVAMTGDGVNDVLALKDADCGVAMASGSDAAVNAAQVVLLESDFSKMPEVVMEGRRVVNNIQRSASLFLVKNIFSFLLAIFSAIFMIKYPLEPSQVSLISMFTIGVPGFFLALQPNKELIKGHFLTNVGLKALPAGLTDVIAVGALAVFGEVFALDSADISTAATMLLAIVGFMILYRICAPMNVWRRTLWIGCIVGICLAAILFPKWFAISGLSKKCIMLLVVFSVTTEPVYRYLTQGVEALREWVIQRKERTKKGSRS